jgi:hypothetical protein
MSTVAQQHHSVIGRFFRNPKTGELVVFQMPNIPLWLFLAATAVRMLVHPRGAVGTGVSIVATVSLAVWAVLEIARGESPFRRVLGAVVLIGGVLSYLLR